MGPDDSKLLQIIGAVSWPLGVTEINTNSKIVRSIVNGCKGSVAQNSHHTTSQDSREWGEGTPHNGIYGKDTFSGFRYLKG